MVAQLPAFVILAVAMRWFDVVILALDLIVVGAANKFPGLMPEISNVLFYGGVALLVLYPLGRLFWHFVLSRPKPDLPNKYVTLEGAVAWLYEKTNASLRVSIREGASISDDGDIRKYAPSMIAFWVKSGGGKAFGRWHEGGPIEEITYQDIERDIFNEAFNEKGNPRPVEFFVLRSDLKRLKEYYEQDST